MPREEAIGRLCSEVFRSSMCESAYALGKTLKTGTVVVYAPDIKIVAKGPAEEPEALVKALLAGSLVTGVNICDH